MNAMKVTRAVSAALLATTTLLPAEPAKPTFHYTIFIARPAQDVWDALTQKPLVDRYYMAPLQKLELEKGGRIAYGDKVALIMGRVMEIEPPKKLVHSFAFTGSTDPESVVSYEIAAVGDRMCSLSITHSGFASENQSYTNISGGWPVIASSLKTLLETGKSLPWPEKGLRAE